MKVLFLDFDGVLHPFGAERRGEAFDPACCGNIGAVLEVTGAHVVVSSAWRHDHSLWELERLLQEHDVIDRYGRVVGVTDKTGPGRGDEIKRWVEQHKPEAYAIVDDFTDACEVAVERPDGAWVALEDAELAERFVHTNGQVGCTLNDAAELVQILGVRSVTRTHAVPGALPADIAEVLEQVRKLGLPPPVPFLEFKLGLMPGPIPSLIDEE